MVLDRFLREKMEVAYRELKEKSRNEEGLLPKLVTGLHRAEERRNELARDESQFHGEMGLQQDTLLQYRLRIAETYQQNKKMKEEVIAARVQEQKTSTI